MCEWSLSFGYQWNKEIVYYFDFIELGTFFHLFLCFVLAQILWKEPLISARNAKFKLINRAWKDTFATKYVILKAVWKG